LAVTTSAETRLSQASPYFPHEPANTTPRVRPAMPVSLTVSSCGQGHNLRLAIESPSGRRLAHHPTRCWINTDAFHRSQVDDETAVTRRMPCSIVTATAHGHRQVVSTGELHGGITSRHRAAGNQAAIC